MKYIISDEEHRRRWAEETHQARLNGDLSFQNWFDKSESLTQTIVRGYWDFSIHILPPKVCSLMTKPEEKVALEIGYGGGRLLNAACSFFRHVIGIDIHDESNAVQEVLNRQGKNNFKLVRTSGRSIDVDNASIDFIYSFIVIQHLPSFSAFENYIKESYRCLKKGGVAQLYFGKWSIASWENRLANLLRRYIEREDARPGDMSLLISVSKVSKVCRNIGFSVIDMGTSYKRVPDGYPAVKGQQNYITLLKRW